MEDFMNDLLKENYRVDANFRWLGSQLKETEELCLTVCGIENCSAEKYYGPTVREDWHIHMVLHGKGYLEIDDQIYPLNRGKIFVTPPGKEIYYYSDKKNPWSYCWISCSGIKAAAFLERAGITPECPIRDSYMEPEDFLQIVEKILNHHELTMHNELLRTSYLYEAMALLVETNNKKTKKDTLDYSEDIYINSAIDYMHKHLQTVQINEVASHIGLSRYYFTKIFKEKMNISPKEYLVKERLTMAAKLLRTTTLSVQEIAEQCGYTNPFSFSQSFKNKYGESPKNYREQDEIK